MLGNRRYDVRGKIQGTIAAKIGNCLNCGFYQLVQREERPRFETSAKILERLK